MPIAAPAASLVATGVCSASCLLAIDADCACRCASRFHGLLAVVAIDVDPAKAASIADLGGRERASSHHQRRRPRRPLTDDDLRGAARAANKRALADTGRPISVRALIRELSIGQERAIRLRAWLDESDT